MLVWVRRYAVVEGGRGRGPSDGRGGRRLRL